MNTYAIKLDDINLSKDSIVVSAALLRNAILSKLERYIAITADCPNWILDLRSQRWHPIKLNASLIFLITKNPLIINWNDLYSRITRSLSFLPVNSQDNFQDEVIQFYNNSLANKHDHVRAWQGPRGNIIENLSVALQTLKDQWPLAFVLIENFINEIILIDNNFFFSGSFPRCHGAVLISPKTHWLIADYIEALIHEASHLELNIRRMLDPFVINEQEEVYSPIRRERRPLLGILHAAFVLCRTTEAFTKLKTHNDHQERAEFLGTKFEPILYDTLATLKKSAQFTEIGQKLYDNMSAKADCLKSK